MKKPSKTNDNFAAAMADVMPLKDKANQHYFEKPAPRHSAAQGKVSASASLSDLDSGTELKRRAASPLAQLSLDSADTISYHQPGVQHGLLRKLRRASLPVEAELDLHGLNAAAAAKVTEQFIAQALSNGKRCVKIIHGKGKSSAGRPVLKNQTIALLQELAVVLAFTTPLPQHGGSGVVILWLKAQR